MNGEFCFVNKEGPAHKLVSSPIRLMENSAPSMTSQGKQGAKCVGKSYQFRRENSFTLQFPLAYIIANLAPLVVDALRWC